MTQFLENNCLLVFILSIVFLAVAIIEIVVFLQWQKKSKYEAQMLMFKDKALVRQIDAHFIFNFLNSLQSHLISDQKVDAIKNLGKFSNVLRRFLENSLHTQLAIQKELDALKLYMEIEQFRFKNIFDFKIIMDEQINTLQYKMPSFLLQPFVENALYHGVLFLNENDNRKGKITINFKLMESFIQITVDDNGVGRKKAQEMERGREKKALGNQFIEKRLETLSKIFKKNFSVQFFDKKDEETGEPLGTKVEITIPQIY